MAESKGWRQGRSQGPSQRNTCQIGQGYADAIRAIAKYHEWENLLGNDISKPVEPIKTSKIPNKPSTKPNGQVNGNTVTVESVRPQRTNKKRSYGDASFEGYTGYAEGIEDDDADTGGGYSSGDTQFSRKSGRAAKKRKKVRRSDHPDAIYKP